MGNPAFSVSALQAMHSCWGDPVGVYTAPDRRRGRGLSKGFSDIKAYSLDRGWPIFQPASLKRGAAIQQFTDLAPDLIVVAAYGLLIPPEMLRVPRHGFLNIHPSLLPLYRGPSPVPSAILDGVEKTGVSLMLLEEGLDTGPVLAQEATKILPGEKAYALTLRLFSAGARLLAESAPRWIDGRIYPQPQDSKLATYTSKLTRADGRVNWHENAALLCRRFRAYTPWPGLYTHWQGKRLRLLDVEELPVSNVVTRQTGEQTQSQEALQGKTIPGVVEFQAEFPGALVVGAGDGTGLAVRELQLEGRRPQPTAEFLRGYPQILGARLPS